MPVADQGLIAAFNLALQLALLRFATPADYGLFVLWQSLIMMMVGFQDAMIGVPLAVRISYDPTNQRRFALERQLSSFAGLFVVAAACVGLAAVTLTAPGRASPTLAVAVGLYAASFMIYASTRFLCLSRMQFGVALVLDGTYSALSLLAVVILYWRSGAIALEPLFFVLSAPPVLAAIAARLAMPRPPRLALRPRMRRTLARYRPIWRDTRWTAAAALAGELQNRAFVFVLTAVYGPAAMAGVFAGMLVLRQISVLVLAFTAFARPYMARLRERGDLAGLARFTGVSIAFLAGLYVVNLVFLGVAWPLVEAYVYAGKYEGMWPVVVVWTLISLAQVPVPPLAVALVALGRYRADSLAGMIGAAITLVAVTVLALTTTPLIATAGSIVGLLTTSAIMLRALRRELVARAAPARSTI